MSKSSRLAPDNRRQAQPMRSLLLMGPVIWCSCCTALAVGAPLSTIADVSPMASCTALRLGPLVGPTGIEQAWPTTDELPAGLEGTGLLLSDADIVADGYSHTLFVDIPRRSAYLVEEGGLAGLRRIYGPLPVATCAGSPEAYKVSVTLSYEGRAFATPVLVIKPGAPATIAMTGPNPYALSVTVQPLPDGSLRLFSSLDSAHGEMAPVLVVKPGVEASVSTGQLSLSLTASASDGE